MPTNWEGIILAVGSVVVVVMVVVVVVLL